MLLAILAPPEPDDFISGAPPPARRDLDCAALLSHSALSLGANPLLVSPGPGASAGAFAPSALAAVAALLRRRLAAPDLRRLDLSGCRLGGAALAALAPSLASRTLDTLELRASDLQSAAELAPLAWEEGAEAAAAAAGAANGDGGEEVGGGVARAFLPALRHLHVEANPVLLRRPRWRAEVLAVLPRLVTLNGELAALNAECDAAAAENVPGPGLERVEREVSAGSLPKARDAADFAASGAGAPEAALREAITNALDIGSEG
jgi:hypothetical protein